MFDTFFEQAVRLNESGQPFALAVVVRHEKPSSGKTGDKAMIRADGTIAGWIGGGCTQPVVIREARKALADGKPRLVRIAPSPHESLEGIVDYTMTCHSGGALDVYIEPVFPKSHLVVFGASVVAETLARLGKAMDWHITVVAPDADASRFAGADELLTVVDISDVPVNEGTFIVVATQGEDDEGALEAALNANTGYLAFVASRKKAAAVFETLRDRGVRDETIGRVKVPAGLDINAKTPAEIAVSILAEIIQVMHGSRDVAATAESSESVQPTETLRIGEMSCAHCVDTVEKTLRRIDGVTIHCVDIGTAAVSYDPDVVPRSRIVEAMAARGYPVLSD